MSFLNTILDIIFPVNCLSCGKSGTDLCLKCLLEAPISERECERWIFPLYEYRHPSIKSAIWLLKYKGRKKLANTFAEAIYGKIIEELADLSVMENFNEPVLIPIPLSSKRYRTRGYNQASLICKKLIEIDKKNNSSCNLKLEKDVLVKIKNQEHQAHIENRRARFENIAGSFTVKNEGRIKNKNIILIDDVITTGATLSEAKKTLKQYGAKSVIAFTVAH
ncbi:ComF family protein [Candidatus Nomurabacteria bacterium]|nr:ComF family protein [Candidatus Nomurabacteria bacterium]